MNCLLLVLVIAPLIRGDNCPSESNTRIQECVQPVGEYAKMLNSNQEQASSSQLGAFSLPNMGRRVFNDLCKLVGKFNDCVKEVRRECTRHVTIGLIDSSYGFLCNEGYNTFIESAECLMELDRKTAVKTCHDHTLTEIQRANSQSTMSLTEKVDKMCGALNFFAGCVKTPIKKDCGLPAWQVIYRVLKDTTKTLMPGCIFDGGSERMKSATQSSSHSREGKKRKTTREQWSTSTTTTLPTDFIVEGEEQPEPLSSVTSEYYQLSSVSPFFLPFASLLILLLFF